jgi:AraC-like DNA-binding protein
VKEAEWVRYWRVPQVAAEAMHARFTSHTYHRHSHETYSFGVTEAGAQAFSCRHSSHVSASGQVMAFNPDDPHDGHSGHHGGFIYRMVHIEPAYFAGIWPDQAGDWPLFREPVIADPGLAASVTRLHAALAGPATALARYEALADTAVRLRRHASAPGQAPALSPATAGVAARIRDLLADLALTDLSAEQVAAAAGCSKYAAYRAFIAAYGLTPAQYQRQLRLHSARRQLRAGISPARAAAETGFADQAHLTRWFRRCYGITPAAYQSSRA